MKWISCPGRRFFLAVLLAALVTLVPGNFAGNSQTGPLLGFWGTLYPEYCFSSRPSEDAGEIRFTFRWLRTPSIGDRIGKKYQSECKYEDRQRSAGGSV